MDEQHKPDGPSQRTLTQKHIIRLMDIKFNGYNRRIFQTLYFPLLPFDCIPSEIVDGYN